MALTREEESGNVPPIWESYKYLIRTKWKLNIGEEWRGICEDEGSLFNSKTSYKQNMKNKKNLTVIFQKSVVQKYSFIMLLHCSSMSVLCYTV
jgi:hypothetical protein